MTEVGTGGNLRRWRLPLIVGVVAAVAFVAWWMLSSSQSADRSAADVKNVKGAVVRYNAALVKGFETMDMEVLNTVATRDQAYTEFYQMSALGEARVRLVSTLKDIGFPEVRVESPATSTVDTIETWDYRQVSLDTSKTVRTEAGVVYRLTYRLVNRGGRWLVDEVKTTGTPWRVWPGSTPPSAETTPSP